MNANDAQAAHRTHPPLDLRPLQDDPMPAWKGVPAAAVGQPLHALGALGLSVLDGTLPYPVAVLKRAQIEHNADWMRRFVERAGASLCPHGKTTMAPQLFERQLAHGAWGMTAATASHVRLYRRFGVQRILLANQLLGQANLDLVLDDLRADPGFDFYCLVDSPASLQVLQQALARRPIGRPLQVLLEVGIDGGRTGVRSLEAGIALGRAIREAAPGVALRGIEAFEGIAPGPEAARVDLGVHTMLERIVALARQGLEENWFAPGEMLLTAGGSAFFDVVADVLTAARQAAPERPVRVVLRSGCYLTHDALHYERMQARMRQRSASAWGPGPGLQNAIEVWSLVQSVPEPQRAICALGRRDISYDMELPRVLWWFRPGLHTAPQAAPPTLAVVGLNDQHAYVDSRDGPVPFEVGDLLGFGIAHPCTTFDKWPLLYLVDEDWRVTGGVRTFF